MEFGLYAGALAGLVMIIIGWRGRRIDDRPYCRRCRHCLTGADDPDRCPECGRDVQRARSVRIGARRRRPVLLLLGAILFLGGAGSGGSVSWTTRVAGRDPASLKPAWWLLLEARWRGEQGATAALRELDRRMLAGELSDEVLLELAQRGLELQADETTAWIPEWGNVIEGAWHAGVLDDAALDRYVDQSTTPYLVARNDEATGHRCRMFLVVPPPRCAASSMFTLVAWIESAQINGRSARIVRSTQESRSFCAAQITTSFSAMALCESVDRPDLDAELDAVGRLALTTPGDGLPSLSPGRIAQVRRTLRSMPLATVRAFGTGSGRRGGTGPRDLPDAPIIHARKVERGRTGELALNDGPLVELLVDERDRAAMADAFSAGTLTARMAGGTGSIVSLNLNSVDAAPAGFAFRVVIEANGERAEIGRFTSADRARREWRFQEYLREASFLNDVNEVRILLEPDPEMIEIPPSMTEIWGEAIDLGTAPVMIE